MNPWIFLIILLSVSGCGNTDSRTSNADVNTTHDTQTPTTVSTDTSDTTAECPPSGRITPTEHIVTVTETGDFVPAITCIIPGDKVVWEFQGSRYLHSIVPIRAPTTTVSADTCRSYLPYDPTQPNEFLGPLPEAVSGLFSRAKDKQGIVAKGEYGACKRYGKCAPLPGEMFCHGATTGGSERVAAGECYGPGHICKPTNGDKSCSLKKQEPGGYLYSNHSTTWTNPAVRGVLLVVNWKDLEPQKGVYDWTDLDRSIQAAVDHGKFFSLAIRADATRTGLPEWLFDPQPAGMGMERLTFYDKYGRGESCSDARRNDRVAAHVLDYRFRARYFGILAAVAKHLKQKNAHYRALAYVKPSGANLQSPENHLPKGCLETQSGVSSEACKCVIDNTPAYGLKKSINHCKKTYGDTVECCGLCNDGIWETAKYYSGPDDTQGSTYTGPALVEFYTQQLQVIRKHFPGKSMSYMLIQDGFPKIGVPDGKSGVWITEQILIQGANDHGIKFVVQHNALNNKTVLNPWVDYRTTLDKPWLLTDFNMTIDEYFDSHRLSIPWLPEDAGITFTAKLVDLWSKDQSQLKLDPAFSPLSANAFIVEMQNAGVEFRDPCLLDGETVPTHPKTMAHYRLYHGGSGACANAWVIRGGINGQITAKQNNVGIEYTDQFLSSLENALEHTDAVMVEAYETVIQRAMADGAMMLPLVEKLHVRRRVDWNRWADQEGWVERKLPPDFPKIHSHTFTKYPRPDGAAPTLFYYVHGSKCLSNPKIGKIVMQQAIAQP